MILVTHLRIISNVPVDCRFRYRSEAGKSVITGDDDHQWPVIKVCSFLSMVAIFDFRLLAI